MTHSYFEGEADQEFELDKTFLENELWTQLRIDPQGEFDCIPSLEYLRYRHEEVKAYKAMAKLENGRYELNYPDLNRTLVISFNSETPYEIESWEETFISGYGGGSQSLTTKATKLNRIKAPYWKLNSVADEAYQDSLLLR